MRRMYVHPHLLIRFSALVTIYAIREVYGIDLGHFENLEDLVLTALIPRQRKALYTS